MWTQNTVEAWILRLIIVVVGLGVLGLIYWHGSRQFGQQGRRVSAPKSRDRQEPDLGHASSVGLDGMDPDLQAELTRLSREISDHRGQSFAESDSDHFTDTTMSGRREPKFEFDLSGFAAEPDAESAEPGLAAPESSATPNPASRARPESEIISLPAESSVGARREERIDRIVTLFICANDGEMLRGSDIVVAAEKTGLVFGHLGIFHSLIPGKPESGPIFSMASMVKPGHFDMRRIQELRTPGLTLFMALPGPMRALDAWDSMFPIANRLGELLGAQVLDEHRNALGRQRIQHLRDELRAYDREQDKNVIKRPW
ncbi:cell division protein ZipA [Ahniella affigens]|uniref:Cell division protein ZipA n=1 Tax=Ahniella affigens TaxID=2021234 RepID=A0A2P1PQJ0_9GAMM|nr:cell division protein ZipA [Ahniella affigens]AVP97104.1 cell division protein ZipA [Ahniella affigens]